MIDDRLSVDELIDGDLEFARRQFVLSFVFINTSDAYVRFGLKAMAFAERAVERSDRFVALRSFSVDAALDRRGFRVNCSVATRRFYFGQRAIGIVEIQ